MNDRKRGAKDQVKIRSHLGGSL